MKPTKESTKTVSDSVVEDVTVTEVKETKKAVKKITATVTAKLLNIRAKDDVTSDVIEKVAEGTTLKVKSTNPDWTEVTTPSGSEGFAMTQFLNIK